MKPSAEVIDLEEEFEKPVIELSDHSEEDDDIQVSCKKQRFEHSHFNRQIRIFWIHIHLKMYFNSKSQKGSEEQIV